MIAVAIIRTLFSPVGLITVFGPMLLHVNLLALRASVTSSETTGSLSHIRTILDDIWVYALLDFNTQLYTLLLAWIIFFAEFIGAGVPLLRRYPLAGALRRIQNSAFSIWFCVGVAILFIGGLILMFSGMLSEPGILQKYLPEGSHIRQGMRVPTPNSPITWFRGVIFLFGVSLFFWRQRIMPALMDNPR